MIIPTMPALLMTAMLCASCATVISGTTAKIHIDGDVGEPVTIVTSRDVYRNVTLPATVEVSRRSLGGQHIQINSENYVFSDIVLRNSVNPWSIADAVAYGIPLVVDLLTNAASVPQQDHFFITPDAPRAQADSLHRADSLRMARDEEERRMARLRARQLPSHFCRHELRGVLGFGNCQASHDRDRMTGGYMERYDLGVEGECFDLVGDAYLQAGLEYHCRLNRRWDIGVVANWGLSREVYSAYYSFSGEFITPETHPEEYADAEELCRFFVAAPSVRYTWYEVSGCRCYSRVALGALRHHLTFDYRRYPWKVSSSPDEPEPLFTDSTDKIKWRMACQLTALGVSFGGENFHFFGELGYGSLGVVRLGLGFMF